MCLDAAPGGGTLPKGREVMKRILVCIDGSPRGPGVLHAAATLAKTTGAQMLLCRSIGVPAELPPSVWKLPQDSLYDSLRDEALAYLNARANELEPELVEGVRVPTGTPWKAICDEARKERVDLIVIGSHGYGGLDRILGTNAAKIVNHAMCSVLVVRGGDLFDPTKV
jgi:nucleotide-binding universal stress UspA family protein